MADWNYENAAHLLKRAAFGGTPQQIQDFLDAHGSVAEAVDSLVNFNVSKKKPPGGSYNYQSELKQKRWWVKTFMKAAKNPPDALREKMTLFWHNHLCSGLDKVRELAYQEGGVTLMSIQNSLFRRYANGNFRDLVRDFNRDGANLYYLDGIINRASDDGVHVTCNENFGREVLELFTVGINELAADGSDDPARPCYTEDDVHQLARALTGWTVRPVVKGVGAWRIDHWDNGNYNDSGGNTHHPGDPITIFGVTNNNFRINHEIAGTPDDVLKLILEREDFDGNNQTAMYLCRKLWTWFAYPAPAPGLKALLATFASTFVAGGFEMKPLLTAMFNHDEFYSEAAKTRTVKNPVDFVVGTVRALGVKSNGKPIGDSDELYDLMDGMGMELFEPPNVAGWPGGKRWITTGTLVSRLEFTRRVAEAESGSSALPLASIVPIGNAAEDPAIVVDSIITQLGLDDTGLGVSSQGGVALTLEQRQAVLDFITNNGLKPTLDLSTADTDDAKFYVRGAIALVLHSGENQVF
jgi:uncharacterized protein (DUF1800 family)